jgi:hypothetical protein
LNAVKKGLAIAQVGKNRLKAAPKVLAAHHFADNVRKQRASEPALDGIEPALRHARGNQVTSLSSISFNAAAIALKGVSSRISIIHLLEKAQRAL